MLPLYHHPKKLLLLLIDSFSPPRRSTNCFHNFFNGRNYGAGPPIMCIRVGQNGCGSGGGKYKLLSPAKLPISRSPCITIHPGLGLTSFLESPVLLSNMKAEPSPTTGPGQSQFMPATVTSNEFSIPAPVSIAGSGTSTPTEGDSDELNHRENSNSLVQTSQFNHKASGASVISSNDGYNWQKYGQKHVKGSEFPGSYYKCTHPNCEVKKLFERSHEGQITEIMYKGTHDHPKPQPSRWYNSGTVMSVHEERSDKFSSLTGGDDNPSSIYEQICNINEPNSIPEQFPIRVNDDCLEDKGSLPNKACDKIDDDDPFSKRRKMEFRGIDVTTVVKPIREPRVVVQTLSEVDILDDGYRWRKYGQKVVRGNPNPRSYYKCTNAGCPVRKHVERASHDPKAVITTYEGKHNHDAPTAKNVSNHDTAGPASISLDLGVGMSSVAEK